MHGLMANQQDTAALLGLSTKTLQKLTVQGIVPRELDGNYALAKAVPAYLRHRSADSEARQQRIAALKVQTAAATLRTRRQLGDLMSRGEAKVFAFHCEDVVRRLWSALAAGLFHRLRVAEGLGGEGPARVLMAELDGIAQDELAMLAERLRLMLDGLRGDLADDDRLDRLQAELAGEKPPKPRRRD